MAELNPRIEKRIKNSISDEAIKDFILELLRLELEKGPRWNYSEIYDKNIEKFSSKYKFKENK